MIYRKTCVTILYLTAKYTLPCVNHYIEDCFKISALSFAFHHHEHITCTSRPALRTVFDPKRHSSTHTCITQTGIPLPPLPGDYHVHLGSRIICTPTAQVKVQTRCKHGLCCTCEHTMDQAYTIRGAVEFKWMSSCSCINPKIIPVPVIN
jgi:hypothetical protein